MDKWKAGSEVVDTVKDLISKYHTHLLTLQNEFAVIFREKAAKAGDDVSLGKAGKAPPLLGVLGDIDYKFILEIASDEWAGLSEKERVALLDHLLCACRTKEDKNGAIQPYIQPPPGYYKEEVERHGWWRTGSTNKPDKSAIEEIFGV